MDKAEGQIFCLKGQIIERLVTLIIAMLAHGSMLWLFYLKYLRGQRGQLGHNVTREICSYIADYLLAHVTSTFLRFFNSYAWGPQVPLRTPIQADQYSTWVMLEDKRVFCSGGGNS